MNDKGPRLAGISVSKVAESGEVTPDFEASEALKELVKRALKAKDNGKPKS